MFTCLGKVNVLGGGRNTTTPKTSSLFFNGNIKCRVRVSETSVV